MSPSVLSYGNVDNDKCRKVISTKMTEIPKRLNKTHRRFQNLALKWFQCLLIIIIHSNQSFNQSINQSRNSLDITVERSIFVKQNVKVV